MQLTIYDCGIEDFTVQDEKKSETNWKGLIENDKAIKAMNQNFIIVRPLRSRCVIGQLNIAKYLLNVRNPLSEKKKEEFTPEDMKEYKRYQELKRVNATFNTFLPTDIIHSLSRIRNEVRNYYSCCCVNPYLPYMDKNVYKEQFEPFVKEKLGKLQEVLVEVEQNWEKIINEFSECLMIAMPEISNKDRTEIMNSLPGLEEFISSYQNVFLFEVDNFSKQKQRVNFMSEKVKSAKEIACDDLKKIIKDALIELIEKCDRFVKAAKDGTVKPRTRGMFNELSENLKFKTAFLGNQYINDVVKLLAPARHLSTDRCEELSDEAVIAAYKILVDWEMLDSHDLKKLKIYSNKLLKGLI